MPSRQLLRPEIARERPAILHGGDKAICDIDRLYEGCQTDTGLARQTAPREERGKS